MKLASGTTARAVAEWIGATPDTPLPDRVFLRIWDRQGGKCAKTGARLYPGNFIKEHVKPLWAGGENRESNIALYLATESKVKTKIEAGQKAKADRVKKKHLLPKPKSKLPSRPFGQWYAANVKQIHEGDFDT